MLDDTYYALLSNVSLLTVSYNLLFCELAHIHLCRTTEMEQLGSIMVGMMEFGEEIH